MKKIFLILLLSLLHISSYANDPKPTIILVMIPKFYIKTLNDKIISPTTQNQHINRLSFVKIYAIGSGHSFFVSHPPVLAKISKK